tara:strand:- start:520 stop:822 length:303 start_codon:yes stop_codon:yes gene_type:complete
MANASRRSKQKQQTSKKESQVQASSQPNGQTAPEPEKIRISAAQADLFKQLLAASTEAQNQVQFAMLAAGIEAQEVIGGDLDSNEPYFVIRNDSSISVVD